MTEQPMQPNWPSGRCVPLMSIQCEPGDETRRFHLQESPTNDPFYCWSFVNGVAGTEIAYTWIRHHAVTFIMVYVDSRADLVAVKSQIMREFGLTNGEIFQYNIVTT